MILYGLTMLVKKGKFFQQSKIMALARLWPNFWIACLVLMRLLMPAGYSVQSMYRCLQTMYIAMYSFVQMSQFGRAGWEPSATNLGPDATNITFSLFCQKNHAFPTVGEDWCWYAWCLPEAVLVNATTLLSSHRQNSNPVSLSRSMASPAAIRSFFRAIAVLVHTRTRRSRDSSLRTRGRYLPKAVHDHWRSATRSARVTELVFAALSRPKIKFAPDTAPGPNTEPEPFIKEGQACLSQACSVASSNIDSAFRPSNGPTALAREIASSFRDQALFAFVARSAPVLKVSTLRNRVWITFFLSFAARL